MRLNNKFSYFQVGQKVNNSRVNAITGFGSQLLSMQLYNFGSQLLSVRATL